MNDQRRLIGCEVMVSTNGCTLVGTLLSSGNHGVVLDVNGSRRTFSGFATVRPADALVTS